MQAGRPALQAAFASGSGRGHHPDDAALHSSGDPRPDQHLDHDPSSADTSVRTPAPGDRASPSLDLFDAWPGAAVLLDRNGRLLRCTRPALRLLARIGGLERDGDGRLAFADGATQQSVLTAVRRCLDHAMAVPCPLLPRSRALRHAVVMHLHALAPLAGGDGDAAAAALLTALQPERDVDAEEAIVRAVLGLTHGEARVALALHEYADVTLAAQALHTAPGTARSHLKRIYQKLHLTRQGELILLVERCLAGCITGMRASSGQD